MVVVGVVREVYRESARQVVAIVQSSRDAEFLEVFFYGRLAQHAHEIQPGALLIVGGQDVGIPGIHAHYFAVRASEEAAYE